MPRQRLYEIAESQLGYFTAKQALKAGYSRRVQSYHAAKRNWLRIQPGIYRLRDFPSQKHEEFVRWTLWSRNAGVISHASAAAYYELGDLMPSRVHLTVPPGFRKRVDAGVIMHRGTLSPHDSRQATGFSVTTPARTIIDLAVEGTETNWLAGVVRDALKQGQATREDLDARAASLDESRRIALRRLLKEDSRVDAV